MTKFLQMLLCVVATLAALGGEVVSSSAGGWFAVDGRGVKDTTFAGEAILGGETEVALRSSPNAWGEAGDGTSATITWQSTSRNSGTVTSATTADSVTWMPEARSGTNTLTYTSGSVVKTAKFWVMCLQPENPVIIPESGTTFGSSLTITMTCPSEEATIYYTTDGSEPTTESTPYRRFRISGKTTIKARAFYENGSGSEIVTAEYALGRCADPVITAADMFTGSKSKVKISCATEGATIRYTLNGSEPNSNSTRYTGAFLVTESRTVKAYAVKSEFFDSSTVTQIMTREGGLGDGLGAPDHVFASSGDAAFRQVTDTTAPQGVSLRSGAIGNNGTSVLTTTVIGPGTLTFKWKTSCEEDPDLHAWDHAEFAVNGSRKALLEGVTGWQTVTQKITGTGTNTLTWTYKKDDLESAGEDCAWVADFQWASAYTTTQTTEVPVPYAWLREKCMEVVDEYASYETVAKQLAENGRLTVEQAYVAGLDPDDPTSEFSAQIEMVDGTPVVRPVPDLNTNGVIRTYKVLGREKLETGDWETPVNSSHRFFKVTVEMP